MKFFLCVSEVGYRYFFEGDSVNLSTLGEYYGVYLAWLFFGDLSLFTGELGTV